jgi:hypothetical protein
MSDINFDQLFPLQNLIGPELVEKCINFSKKNIEIFQVQNYLMIGSKQDIQKNIQNYIDQYKDISAKEKIKTEERNKIQSILENDLSIDFDHLGKKELLDLFLDEEKLDKIVRTLKNKTMW